jgi:hypothetical protein
MLSLLCFSPPRVLVCLFVVEDDVVVVIVFVSTTSCLVEGAHVRDIDG